MNNMVFINIALLGGLSLWLLIHLIILWSVNFWVSPTQLFQKIWLRQQVFSVHFYFIFCFPRVSCYNLSLNKKGSHSLHILFVYKAPNPCFRGICCGICCKSITGGRWGGNLLAVELPLCLTLPLGCVGNMLWQKGMQMSVLTLTLNLLFLSMSWGSFFPSSSEGT